MILNLPIWLPVRAHRFVWHLLAICCFALTPAKPQLAEWAFAAIIFKKLSFFNFIYHLHCAISGPG